MSQATAPKKPPAPAEHLANVLDIAPPPDPWHAHDATRVFAAPLPPVKFVCPGLDLAPGRPTGIYSKPGVGKTLQTLDLCLAVATGTKVFRRFECERGRVAFITYDVGFYPTATRARQIANGRGHTLEELEGQLEIMTFPSIYLNSEGAEALFLERFRDHKLVVIDCFRDAIPGVKENESEVGFFLKLLARASEQTETAYQYLHHLQKGETIDPLDAGRGSGAIRGASGAIWLIEGSGHQPRTFTHSRTHDASLGMKEPFVVEMTTLPAGGAFETAHPSILLTAKSLSEARESTFFSKVESNKTEDRERLRTLLRLLRAHPNSGQRGLRKLCKGTILGSKDTLGDALDEAIEAGLVRVDEVKGKGGTRDVYNVTGADP